MQIKKILKKIIPLKIIQALRKIERKIFEQLSRRNTPCLINTLIETYCVGKGIEIAPGRKPYCDRKNTVYLEKHPGNPDGSLKVDLVGDAANIPVNDNFFDFLLSSHCLEHCPNTLKVLSEWKRVIKVGGIIFLILPHGDRTFDKYRKKTDLDHHIKDFKTVNSDYDYSHNEEIKEGWSKLSDFENRKKNFEKKWKFDFWDFESRIKQNVIHYHVWEQNEFINILKYIDLKILYVADIVPERKDSFLVIAKK